MEVWVRKMGEGNDKAIKLEMMPDNKAHNKIGINVRILSYILMLIGLLCFILTIYLSAQTIEKYNILTRKTNDFVSAQVKIHEFSDAVEFLTNQAQQAVLTGKLSYMKAYYNEVNVDKRREKALESMQTDMPDLDVQVVNDLQYALVKSNNLMEDESKAMKLIAKYYGIEDSRLPEEIVNAPISEYESKMFPAETKERANEYVMGMDYKEKIEQLNFDINRATKRAIYVLESNIISAQQAFDSKSRQLAICVIISFVILMGTGIIYLIFVISPMTSAVNSIENDQLMKGSLSKEMNLLASVYNEMFKQNMETKLRLQREAEHDAMTGLLNRKAYNKLCEFHRDSMVPMALIIVDIDKFKDVNDTYGHVIGDEAIRRVAALIKESFRTDDYAIRYGGDEFVILMNNFPESQKNIIERKISHINTTLLNGGSDDFPALSISAGVGFSTEGFKDELFTKADIALYHTKENGRCGYTFYEEHLEPGVDMREDANNEKNS